VEFESPHLHHQGLITNQARAPRGLDNKPPRPAEKANHLPRLAAAFAYL
jgi:hypothetical protein